jgi:hypothetical protein
MLIRYIFDQNVYRFFLQLSRIEDIANLLLVLQDTKPIDKH